MKTGIKRTSISFGIFLSMIMLSGCPGSSSNSTYNNQTISSDLATQNPDSSSGDLTDATALKNDIDALFGNTDDEPVDIETGETLEDIFDRVRS